MYRKLNTQDDVRKELENVRILLKFYMAITETLIKSEDKIQKGMDQIKRQLDGSGAN